MENCRIVVTGGRGFVGSAIITALKDKWPKCSIISLDVNTSQISSEDTFLASYATADITDARSIHQSLLKYQPDVVIQTAGLVPTLSDRYRKDVQAKLFKVNVTGTENVLNAAKASGCKAFIFTSSCTVVTDDCSVPLANIDEQWPYAKHPSPYGKSKAEAEVAVLAQNSVEMPTTVLRLFTVIGEGDPHLIPQIHACIGRWETPFCIGKGMNLWDIVYVGNVAEAHVLAAENLLTSRTAAGSTFFIGNHEPMPFRDLQLAIWRHFGHSPPFTVVVPQAIALLLAYVMELLAWSFGRDITISRGSIREVCATRYASGVRARSVLGYEPRICLEDGLRRSCQDYARSLRPAETSV